MYPGLSGVMGVYKPRGVTTRDLLNSLCGQLSAVAGAARLPPQRERVKAGHGGTLDKQAEGLVVVALERGTKSLAGFLASDKTYETRAVLGLDTDTHDLDAEARVVREAPYAHVTREALEAYLHEHYAAAGGVVQQTPPIFSAIKQDGKRLSALVREGKEDAVDLDAKARPVQVRCIKITEWAPPYYSLHVECGGGFYVRSCVRDIGAHFNCGSTMTRLQRTGQCGFSLADAHCIDMSDVAQQRGFRPPSVVSSALSGGSVKGTSDEQPNQQQAQLSSLDSAVAAAGLVGAPNMVRPASLLPFSKENVIRVLAVPLEQRRKGEHGSATASGSAQRAAAAALAAVSLTAAAASSDSPSPPPPSSPPASGSGSSGSGSFTPYSDSLPAPARAVLDFWFLQPDDAKFGNSLQMKWFKKDADFDAEIRARFGAHIDAALQGGLADWSAEGGVWGTVARIVVLDQFTRNTLRGRKESFDGDALALQLSRSLIGSGADRSLPLAARMFVYMPLEHSESMEDQRECLRQFRALEDDCRAWAAAGHLPDQSQAAAQLVSFAHRHLVIIEQWGRFPHRNAMLGRQSTPEEIEFLKQPGSSF